MSVIVTDTGFAADDWTGDFIALGELAADHEGTLSLDVPSDGDVSALKDRVDAIDMIRVDFPAFSDGRGFTIAGQLRRMGFRGRLRARGHVIADQYAMARRMGFDEVEISDELAHRQPEDQWAFRADWTRFHHQARLRG
ncbi:DUF934 domain-containing protein [Mangrovicoccus algicola]|uniref:DUF934 domain-containing protein n=1 Tax=Mangrovicoccus algicola TaxID=2771008 RepID=A0A8J7CYC2_9RHOB|nr:DUF934 domain-containing protein [Mangrovicoccus algicola]MBE3639387.1 DUF934 domain-containing protein [Mangrovicoccus algicola]